MDPTNSFAASSFRKVLKGFEIGGLPYADVQFHLKRLLAAGTSPEELQEVLRRCELITPLPEYAHAEVMQIIEEAKERAAREALAQVPEAGLEESEATANLVAEMEMLRDALEAEQTKGRDIGRALAERIASEQSARARSEEVRRESERIQSELRGARQLISDRDTVIAQMRVALDEANAQLAVSQRDRTEVKASLDSRAKSGAQVQADLDAARARATALEASVAASRSHTDKLQRDATQHISEMATLRGSLAEREKAVTELRGALAERDAQIASLRQASEQGMAVTEKRSKAQDMESQSARRRVDALESEMATLRESLAEREKSATELRGALAERDAQIASLRQEGEQGIATTERRSKAQEMESQSARRRVDALERELQTSRDEATPLRAERDALRAQLMAMQSKLRDNESLVATLQQSVRADARKVAELQSAVAAPPRAQLFAEVAELAPAKAAPLKPAAKTAAKSRARWAAVAATVVVLAVVAWAYTRRASVAVIEPAASVAVPKPGSVLRDCPDCPTLTVLPSGSFEQGSAASGAASFEKPLHAVTIGSTFAMSTSAVTVDQFRAFVAATGRSMQGCDTYDGDWRHRADGGWDNPGFAQTGSHPVTCASWNDATAYAAWLTTKTGHRYRLPSASEWEYAARAGAPAIQPWSEASNACGGANVADQSAARRFPGWAVFACDDGYVFTAPVGSFKPNAFGLNDMLGNVFQWTEDCWRADYVGAPTDGSARTDGDCSERELRGGSWFSLPAYVRANYRNHFGADYRTSSVGIRLVREIES